MKREKRFDGRVVVVTGASSGIGAAAARKFALEGARVVLAARGKAGLTDVADAIIAAGGTATVVPTDCADLDSCTALIETAVTAFGGIDILVNNAGANVRGPLEQASAAEVAQVVAVNLTAPIVLTRLAMPHLRRSSTAAVVNVASLAGRVPLQNEAVYSATKFGLRAFSFALADELAAKGAGETQDDLAGDGKGTTMGSSHVKISVVSPGPVDTGFIMDDLESVPDIVLSQPMSTAEEVADLILDSAADGKRERLMERTGGYLTTLGYLLPGLRRRLIPALERRGKRNKERYRSR